MIYVLFIIADCVKGIDAQQVFGYALFKDGKNTRLSYPLEKFHSDVSGRSFHNGRFIQRMREKAVTLPKYNLSSLVDTTLLIFSNVATHFIFCMPLDFKVSVTLVS
jgi:hypothetical protein